MDVENKEKVFYCSDDTKERLPSQLEQLIKIMISRKRGITEKEVLNASIIIYPNSFAAKVTENDGRDSHFYTFSYLTKYIKEKGDDTLKDKTLEAFQDMERVIFNESIPIHILNGKYKSLYAIQSRGNYKSSFQFYVMKILLNLLMIQQNEKHVEEIKIGGYLSPQDRYDYLRIDEVQCKAILKAIEKQIRPEPEHVGEWPEEI